MKEIELEWEPRLVEEAVREALRGSSQARALDRERETAYRVEDPEERDRSFGRIYARWLEKLSLVGPIREAILEQDAVQALVSRWLVVRALSARQAGSEMFVGEGGRRTVLLRLTPSILARPLDALRLLRKELLYIADMLDRSFEYQPYLPRSPLGPPKERRIQDRYAALWRCSVEGRLVRDGKLPAERRGFCLAEFQRHFACLEDSVEACFERIFGGPRPLHGVLVALASEPEVAFGVSIRPGKNRKGRCPLCGFPTTDFEPRREIEPELRREIRLDHPAWTEDEGLCRQCADLYRCASSGRSKPAPPASLREESPRGAGGPARGSRCLP